MKQTIDRYGFIRAFERADRASQFSRAALDAMFDWIVEREQDMGEEMELDVVALCCEWSEYDTAREAAEAYGWECPDRDKDDESEAETSARIWLDYQTTALDVDGGGVVILQF